jgi:Rrf2 family transcriptional regulator, cysteine metabolism repressor
MTLLNRKVDYALLILCYLYHRAAGGSAREIATHFGISRAFAANILKDLCQQSFVTSERGVKGGYHLHSHAADRTLADLIDTLDGPVQLAECNDPFPEECCSFAHQCPIRAPIAEVHNRIRAVLETVKLVEVLAPPQPGCFDAGLLGVDVSRCAVRPLPQLALVE